MLSLLFWSCGDSTDSVHRYNIVVIHSFPNSGEEGEAFRNYMDEQFEKNGISAKVKHLYPNFIHQTSENSKDSIDRRDPLRMADVKVWHEYMDYMTTNKPDLIFVNDDPSLMWLMKCKDSEEFRESFEKIFTTTPVIFAGINSLDRATISKYKNFTGFTAPINLTNVCNMYSSIYKKDTAYISLGESSYDVTLRKELEGQLSDSTRYTILHRVQGKYTVLQQSTNKNGAFTIIFNNEGDEDIQVKLRLVGDVTHSAADEPMLSCVRERFNDKDGMVLGGYFSSMETEIEDEVRYAQQVLGGHPVASLPIMQHHAHYYLDWELLHSSPLRSKTYKDFPSRIELVNVPFYIKHAAECVWIIIAALVVLALIAYLVTLPFRRVRKQKALQEVERLKREMRLKQLIFKETNAVPWHSKQGVIEFPKEFAAQNNYPYLVTVEEFLKCFHPDYMQAIMQIRNLRDNIGRHKARVKMNIHYDDPAHKDDWHYWDVIANVTPETAAKDELSGVVINVDEEEKARHAQQEAIYSAKEIELKEQFLLNISHQLTEPLEHILNNADSIMGDKPLTTEELTQLNEKLHAGTDNLLKMIDSVMKGEKSKNMG